MNDERIKETIKQVLHNPQVAPPPISYKITSIGVDGNYESEYIDIGDFRSYLKRLEERLVYRLTHL